MIYKQTKNFDQQGAILASILIVTFFLASLLLGLVVLSNANVSRARARILLLQAQYAAESGADVAVATLNGGDTTYAGTVSDTQLLSGQQYRATFAVTVTAGSTPREKIITSTGKVYSPKTATEPTYSRKIQVIAQRSTSTTAAAITSRNIISIGSAVKEVIAKDIYVNGYISMAKNTNELIAENITVAGKNTGSGNCSIGGSGKLVKPSSFSDPTQTKVNLTLAFNNCIVPPGNTSNNDFNVSANNGNTGSIQSTYIPWDQYMDSSYIDAASCTDWTSGSSPRSIPLISSSKRTHYPDAGMNVSTACGNSGDLALGSNQYNIHDNVHLRASLCAASACAPTFNNPSGTIKFIFVEGTINFDSIQTVAGSGPIAFIAYGADPASKVSDCPTGGSVYLGNGGNVNAPSVYFLAVNGICLDKTKFAAHPALGGIGGKNIYIATNSGTPFDLSMDPNFPVASIPIDLSWRAVRYQRL